jgi:hypothetical protein
MLTARNRCFGLVHSLEESTSDNIYIYFDQAAANVYHSQSSGTAVGDLRQVSVIPVRRREQLYMVSQDGFVDGVLSDKDTIDACFRQPEPGDAAAACNTIHRKR